MSTILLSAMEKSSEHKPLSPKPNRIQYWDGAIVPTELMAFQSVLREMLGGEGRKGLKFERLHTPKKNISLYSVRINQAERLLLTEQTTRHGERMLVAVALTHHYKGWEKNQTCTQKLSAYLQRLELDLASLDTLTAEPLPEREQEMLASTMLDDNPAEVMYFSGDFLSLKDDQKKASQMRLPGLLIGMPGTGKTVAGVECLRSLFDANPEVTLYFSSSIAALVEEVSNTWAIQHPEKKVHFLPLPRLLGQFFDMRVYADKTPCQLETLRVYLKQMDAAYNQKLKNDKKAKKPVLLALKVKIAPEKLYEMLQLLALYELSPQAELAEYIIKQCGFEKDNTVSIGDLRSLLAEYRKHLEKHKLYDLGISPLPVFEPGSQPCIDPVLVLDEVQNIPPAWLFSLKQVFGERILGIGDPYQALFAQPMELLWRSIWPQYRKETLNQSLRCPAPVVRMAQSLLGLLHAVGGAQMKGYSGYLSAPESEPNFLAPLFTALPKNYSMEQQGVLHVVVARREQLAAAEKQYADITPFIHCLEDVGGLTFENVLLYGFWEQACWKSLSAADYAKAHEVQLGNLSKTGECRQDIEAWLRQFLVAISRCTKNIWLGQLPKCQQTTQFLAYFGVEALAKSPLQEANRSDEPGDRQPKPQKDFEIIRKEIERLLQQGQNIAEVERQIALAQKTGIQKAQYNLLNQMLTKAKEDRRNALLVRPTPGEKNLSEQASGKQASSWIDQSLKKLSSPDIANHAAIPILESLATSDRLHTLQREASQKKSSPAEKLLTLLVEQYAFFSIYSDETQRRTDTVWKFLLLEGSWPLGAANKQQDFNGHLLTTLLQKRPNNLMNTKSVAEAFFCTSDNTSIRLIKTLPLSYLQECVANFTGDMCRDVLGGNSLGLYHYFERFQSSKACFAAVGHFFKVLPCDEKLVEILEKPLPDAKQHSIADVIFSLFKKADKSQKDLLETLLYTIRHFPGWFIDEQKFSRLQTIMHGLFSKAQQRMIIEALVCTYPDVLLKAHIQQAIFSILPELSLKFRSDLANVLFDQPTLAKSLWPVLAGKALEVCNKEMQAMIGKPLQELDDRQRQSVPSWLFWVHRYFDVVDKTPLDNKALEAVEGSIRALHGVLMGNTYKVQHKHDVLALLVWPLGNGISSVLYYLLGVHARHNPVSAPQEFYQKLMDIFKHYAEYVFPLSSFIFVGAWFSAFRAFEQNKVLGVSELYLLESRFHSQFPDDFWLGFFTSNDASFTACLPAMSIAFFEKYLPMLCQDRAKWEMFVKNDTAQGHVKNVLKRAPTRALQSIVKSTAALQSLFETDEPQKMPDMEPLTAEELLEKYDAFGAQTPIGRSVLVIFLTERWRNNLLDMLGMLASPEFLVFPRNKSFEVAQRVWSVLFDNLATNIGTAETPCYVWKKLVDMLAQSFEQDAGKLEELGARLLLSSWKPADTFGNTHATFAEYLDSLPKEECAFTLKKFEEESFDRALSKAKQQDLHKCFTALCSLKNQKMGAPPSIAHSSLGMFTPPELPQQSDSPVQQGVGLNP